MSEKLTSKKLIQDLSNADYHGEKGHFSSSQLKDVLEDIEYFYKVHISREIVKERTGNQLAIGTYIHTAILEPHLLETDCAVYLGATRRGKEWDAFEEANKHKTIITGKEKEEAQVCIDAIRSDAQCMKYVEPTEKEVSVFSTVMGVPLKARADAICHGAIGINGGRPYILDVKSTSSNAKNEFEIKSEIENWNYDLSAAFYLEVFSSISARKYEDFFWAFASKKWANAQLWKASPEMLAVGRAKLRKALKLIWEYAEKGWKFESRVLEIAPKAYVASEWLEKPPEVPTTNNNDTDLL